MSSTSTHIHITNEWREIAAVVDRYEDAVGDQLPDVSQLLQGVSPANRVAALVELLQVEQEHRWRRRQGKTVEEYLADYPELLPHGEAVRQLARWECRLRCGAGDRDFRKDFSRRFPDLDLECDTLREDATTAAPTRCGRCKSCPVVRPQHIGHYVVETRIGGGAFGVVYRCRHLELNRLAAIKVARDISGDVAAFLHEAKNAAGLAHPNIVGLLDYGKLDDGRPYIIYDYVAGRTLADRIAARDYTLGEAIRWTIALAGALQAAHRRRIYHRDIKPANILVDETGGVHLTDFGLARRDDLFYADDRAAQLGTPSYMSPEQASFRSDWAGPASDIYALGVVLYELLCGRVPFRDMDQESLLAQIRERPPVSPRSLDDQIPARVEDACLRALEKDPAKRFRTAGDFARALQTAVAPRSRRTWLAAAAAVAGVTALGLFVLAPLLQKTPPTREAPPELERPRIQALRDGVFRNVAPDFPPRPGEKLKITAQLSHGKEAYLYVVVFYSTQPAMVLCPDKGAVELPCAYYQTAADHLLAVPQDAKKGAMAVVVGARSKPLEAGILNKFTAQVLPPPPASPLNEFPHEWKSTTSVVRGADNRGVFEFPAGLQKKNLETLFEAYDEFMFPWYGNRPSPGQSHAAAAVDPDRDFMPQ